jgi:hypothetical protein
VFDPEKLPIELSQHIFSFFSDDSLKNCSTVNRSGKKLTIDTLKAKLKALVPLFFSGEDLQMKELSLLSPIMLKVVINFDAHRSRYLLTKNDLIDLAFLNIEVARHVLFHSRLKKNERNDKYVISSICEKFPLLNLEVFKSPEMRFPSEKIVLEAIGKEPSLFMQLLQQERFVNFIAKTWTIGNLASISEEIAQNILDNFFKFPKLELDWYLNLIGNKYENFAIKILNTPQYSELLTENDLMNFGKHHLEAAKIIIETPAFTAKIRECNLEILQDQVMEHLLSASEFSF